MINVFFKNDHCIEINGHACSNEYGKDLICASLSAIVQSALNWFNPEDIKYMIDEGYYYLEVLNNNNNNLYKFELLKIQILSIYKKYKKYINIKGEIDYD